MSDQRQQREQELFNGCLELPRAEWSSYLEQACNGDSPLQGRIERLLAAHLRAENAAVIQRRPVDDVPDLIGPYRLIDKLGEGGMAVVYEAEQVEPVRRRVALKIVKLGMDSRQVIARFMTERQALAAMDHPYVAKVFDAGWTRSGRPYLVMELVNAMPLLDYCQRNRLSIRDRVKLFVSICQAVQHAHQKGVIHRDLKPSNLLVSSDSGVPVPKIIDFGIAKAIGLDIPERMTEFTRVDQALGTPAYMSPEQAGMGRIDIDTRTDVYSLGVILYELLVGRLPADPAETGYVEFLSLLSKGELQIPRPSSNTSGLRRQIEGDLDWIVMKALDVHRERRYDTAIALAEDLERFLKEDPVSARPPTVSYRIAKFIRRHRVQVAAACVAGIAMLAGTIATGVSSIRATRAEAAAIREAAAAREVSEFMVRLFRLANPHPGSGKPTTMRELLDRGVVTIETELQGQPGVQANLFGGLGHVYEALGMFRESKALAEKSLALSRANGREGDLQQAAALLDLGRSNMKLGAREQARKAFEQALALRVRVLGENHPDVARVLNGLGAALTQLGCFEEAVSAHNRALAIQRRASTPDDTEIHHSLRGLGMVQIRKGDFGAASDSFRAVQAFDAKRFGDNHPFFADSLHNAALALEKLNRFEESQSLLERSLDIRKRVLPFDHPNLAFSYNSLGRVLVAQGKLEAALPLFEEAVRIRRAALGADRPGTTELVESLEELRVRLGKGQ
jgi:serine/threonine protein kinase/tetratricopeptide (TPR) repeat protein